MTIDINPKLHPNCLRGHIYAEDVVAGKIVACKYVVGACRRYLREVEDDKWFFDWDDAEKYLRTVQKFDHVIGHWKTKNIVYEPWQCWVWMNIMGFKIRTTGFRRFRVAHVEIARGNAKSAMASQAALYFLAFDNPNGNQISTVATKKDQARIVLDSARAMARKNDSYRKHTGVKVLAHSIIHQKSNSLVRALASEHSGLDGLQDVLAILDELHAMKRDTFEVITSGMSKRADSLTLCITTAGQDVHSVGCSQSSYAKKLCLGEVIDDTFFAVVYTLDEGDDWEDPKVWLKPNPNLGVSVDPVTLQAKIDKALVTPGDIANIKIKHMNIWIAEAQAYYDQKLWDQCAVPTMKMEDFKKVQCRMGLDLASHIDIASLAFVFRTMEKRTDENGKEETIPIYDIFDKSYIPEDTVTSEKNVMYDEYIKGGFLIATPGAAINYKFIQDEATKYALEYRVAECLYDAWNATETAQRLSPKIEMVKIAMNTANFSEPMKKLDALMRKKQLRHNGSPLLRWCLGNVVAKEDHNSNVFPRKSHTKLKIDPIVAILMAMAGWLQTDETESVYETRGMRTL